VRNPKPAFRLTASSPRLPQSNPSRPDTSGEAADDHRPVRVLLVVGRSSVARRLVERIESDFVEVIGWAESVDEAAAMVDTFRPDVVLVATSDVPTWGAQPGFQLDVLTASVRLASLQAVGPKLVEPD
jgi:hypothetical protein